MPRSCGGAYSLIMSAIAKAMGVPKATAISAMITEPTRMPSTPGWMGADHTVPVKKCHLKVLSAHQL